MFAPQTRKHPHSQKRGISTFTPPPGELLRAAESMIRLKGTSNSMAIITGFPCLIDFTPPTETDGPLGAVAIARAFLSSTAASIGLSETENSSPEPTLYLLTDECNKEVLQASIDAAGISNHPRFKFETFPATPDWSEVNDSRLNEIANEISTVSICMPISCLFLTPHFLPFYIFISVCRY